MPSAPVAMGEKNWTYPVLASIFVRDTWGKATPLTRCKTIHEPASKRRERPEKVLRTKESPSWSSGRSRPRQKPPGGGSVSLGQSSYHGKGDVLRHSQWAFRVSSHAHQSRRTIFPGRVAAGGGHVRSSIKLRPALDLSSPQER